MNITSKYSNNTDDSHGIVKTSCLEKVVSREIIEIYIDYMTLCQLCQSSVICETQHKTVRGIAVISKTVIEGGSLMGMFAAKRGRGARLFVVGVRRENISASHKSEAI